MGNDIAKKDEGWGGSTDLTAPADNFADATIARHQKEAQEEIRMAVMLAKQFPRDEMKAYESMMKQCRRKAFAEKGLYSYPRGGTTVEGPSINLARTLAQKWGNIRWGIEVIHDGPATRKIRTWAWDMESNARVSAEDEFEKAIFRKSSGWLRLDGTGKDDERSLRELTFRKASLILRGCLLQLIPADFVEDAAEACKDSMSGSDEPREDRIKAMLGAFNKLGVSKEMLETRLAHKLEATSEPELVDLRNIYNSLRDEHADIKDYFELPKAGKKKPTETEAPSEPSESPETGDDFNGAGGSAHLNEPPVAPPAASQETVTSNSPIVKKIYRLSGASGLGLKKEFVADMLDYRFTVKKYTELTEAEAEEVVFLYELLEDAQAQNADIEILDAMAGDEFQRDHVYCCPMEELKQIREKFLVDMP